MQLRFLSAVFARVGLAALAIAPGVAPASAEDASPWSNETHSQVRLIAGTNTPRQEILRAGLDIKLAPGWKTYWRYPGDSGIPPRFDFGGSTNVKTVQVLWPAPERLADGGGQSIGYRDRVIMPLRVVPADTSKSVRLQLKLNYAVCEKLCVPAEATAQLTLATVASVMDRALAAAEVRVPRASRIGDAGVPAIRAVRPEQGGKRPRIIVDVAAPKDAPVDLFVEGPTADWALPLPEPDGSPTPGLRRFAFDVDGVPAGARAKGAELTFTLTAGAEAIEVKTRLD
jgi:DsbC/DsbD-like thiol-disulfide interchange protein